MYNNKYISVLSIWEIKHTISLYEKRKKNHTFSFSNFGLGKFSDKFGEISRKSGLELGPNIDSKSGPKNTVKKLKLSYFSCLINGT